MFVCFLYQGKGGDLFQSIFVGGEGRGVGVVKVLNLELEKETEKKLLNSTEQQMLHQISISNFVQTYLVLQLTLTEWLGTLLQCLLGTRWSKLMTSSCSHDLSQASHQIN